MPKRGDRTRRLSVLRVPVRAVTQFKGSVLFGSSGEVCRWFIFLQTKESAKTGKITRAEAEYCRSPNSCLVSVEIASPPLDGINRRTKRITDDLKATSMNNLECKLSCLSTGGLPGFGLSSTCTHWPTKGFSIRDPAIPSHQITSPRSKSAGIRIAVISNHKKFDLDEFKTLAKAARKSEQLARRHHYRRPMNDQDPNF